MTLITYRDRAKLIRVACQTLNLPLIATATSLVFLHRYLNATGTQDADIVRSLFAVQNSKCPYINKKDVGKSLR